MENRMIFLFLMFSCFQLSFAQNPDKSDLSGSAKILSEKIKTEGGQAILDAGKSGDKSLVPYLKTLTHKYTIFVQMALAKLGDESVLNQIILETDSWDIRTQNLAIRKLAYVANQKSYNKSYQLLDNVEERDKTACEKELDKINSEKSEPEKCELCCDVMVFSVAAEVVRVLSKTVKDPPIKSYYGTEKDIKIWKKWFEDNKDLIQ